MALQKFYVKINWKNRPSTSTPLGAQNLNHVDNAVDELDNRVVTLDASKFNVSEANSLMKDLSVDPKTGIIKATYYNGSVKQWDLNLEKIPVSFSMSPNGIISMVTSDGTVYTANIASLIIDYQFVDGEEIDFTVSDITGEKRITAIIKNGSIKASKLEPSIQADILNNRILAQTAAADSQTYSNDSKRFAVGGVIAADAQDNAKYYSEQSGIHANAASLSEEKAKTSETNAKSSETAAKSSETNALLSSQSAEASNILSGQSATNAKESENISKENADNSALASSSAIQSAAAAESSKQTASVHAQNASNSASESQAAALESQGWAEKAEQIVDIHIATPDRAGIVKPDGITVKVKEDGTISVPVATQSEHGVIKPDGSTTEVDENGVINVKTATQSTKGIVKGSDGIKVGSDGSIDVDTTFTQAAQLANIIAGEAISVVLGKVSKSIASTIGLDQNALLKSMLTSQNLNDSSKIPTAALTYAMQQTITKNTNDITRINSDMPFTINANITFVSGVGSYQHDRLKGRMIAIVQRRRSSVAADWVIGAALDASTGIVTAVSNNNALNETFSCQIIAK